PAAGCCIPPCLQPATSASPRVITPILRFIDHSLKRSASCSSSRILGSVARSKRSACHREACGGSARGEVPRRRVPGSEVIQEGSNEVGSFVLVVEVV